MAFKETTLKARNIDILVSIFVVQRVRGFEGHALAFISACWGQKYEGKFRAAGELYRSPTGYICGAKTEESLIAGSEEKEVQADKT